MNELLETLRVAEAQANNLGLVRERAEIRRIIAQLARKIAKETLNEH